jgi:hypothetical protein
LGVESKLEQLLEQPSRPFTPGAGPAWPARILQARVVYHVKEQLVYCGVDVAKAYFKQLELVRRHRLDYKHGTTIKKTKKRSPGMDDGPACAFDYACKAG